MYAIFNRLRFKQRVRLAMAVCVVTLAGLAGSVWWFTGAAIDALPPGSPARGGLEVLATLSLVVALVVIPFAVLLNLSIIEMLTWILTNAATAMTNAAQGDLNQRMVVRGKG